MSEAEFQLPPEYMAREKRLMDAAGLTKPDRVPVMPLNCLYYANRALGITNAEAQADYVKRHECMKRITLDLDLDFAPQVFNLAPIPFFEILGVTDFKWPGGELGVNAPNQYIEKEYLQADEYDEYLADPDTFTWKKLWPRFSRTMGLMSQVQIPPVHPFTTGWFLGLNIGSIVSSPEAMEFLQRMLDLGREAQKYLGALIGYFTEMAGLGYPMSWSAGVFPAFDVVSHDLRGMRGTVLDMYRQPDKLLALIERLTPATIATARGYVQMFNTNRVLVPILRGVDGVLSDEQFARFYWPSLKALLLAIIEDGLLPLIWFEADCTSRLKYFDELPKSNIVAHFHGVDRRKTKALIDGKMCFWGNVPSSKLIMGTPQQVKDDVKELIDIFGDNGGLIIDGEIGIPDEARPENVAAMVEAAREYGRY
ncbi:MAG: hypothetical protein KKB20_10760 [Proteobacteria bacterium]|nr:hypothetical protein [Pseudomonadota bacterium]